MWPYFHKSGLWLEKSFFLKCNKWHTKHWPILVFQHSRYAQCPRCLTTKFQCVARCCFLDSAVFMRSTPLWMETCKIIKTLFSLFNVYPKNQVRASITFDRSVLSKFWLHHDYLHTSGYMTLVISNFSYLGPYAWFIKYGRKRWQYKFALLLLIEVTYNMFNFYPVRICAAGLCIWLHRFVYVCVCIYIWVYMWTKKRAFGVLTLENLPLV